MLDTGVASFFPSNVLGATGIEAAGVAGLPAGGTKVLAGSSSLFLFHMMAAS
jgi:hypothetical protein